MSSASSHFSPTELGQEMGLWWSEAIEYKCNNSDILIEQKVTRLDGNDAGDVDICFLFSDEVLVTEILPNTSVIQPDSDIDKCKAKYFLAEIKRSCDNQHVVKKVTQFVKFYSSLFDPANQGSLNLTTLNPVVLNAIRNPHTILLFVYNGDDNVTVEAEMQQAICTTTGSNNFMIHQHKVFIVWCKSTTLSGWKKDLLLQKAYDDNVAKDLALQQTREENVAKDLALQQTREENVAKDLALQQALAEIERLKLQFSQHHNEWKVILNTMKIRKVITWFSISHILLSQ